MQCKYRVILSLDGGGIKGVVPLKILSHIQSQVAEIDNEVDISAWVDVFAATSTGSIIGGALMLRDENGRAKFSPDNLLDIYNKRGAQIFSKNVGMDPQHSVYPLSFILNHFFGNYTIEQLHKRFLFVSYDLNSDSQYLFTDTADRFRSLALSKIMIACSAFPGVYPPLELGNLLLADGIVAAKNPSELAYNYARMFYPKDPIILLSLGTGQSEFNEMDIIDKEMERVHSNMVNLSKKDSNLLYFRFQPILKNPLDSESDSSPENINSLLDDTDDYIQNNKAQFDRLFALMKIKVEQMA
jgi:patatin-like phospholipase/acyl hydrolase